MLHSEATRDCPVDMNSRFDLVRSYYMDTMFLIDKPVSNDFHMLLSKILKNKDWIYAHPDDIRKAKEMLMTRIYENLTRWHS